MIMWVSKKQSNHLALVEVLVLSSSIFRSFINLFIYSTRVWLTWLILGHRFSPTRIMILCRVSSSLIMQFVGDSILGDLTLTSGMRSLVQNSSNSTFVRRSVEEGFCHVRPRQNRIHRNGQACHHFQHAGPAGRFGRVGWGLSRVR